MLIVHATDFDWTSLAKYAFQPITITNQALNVWYAIVKYYNVKITNDYAY